MTIHTYILCDGRPQGWGGVALAGGIFPWKLCFFSRDAIRQNNPPRADQILRRKRGQGNIHSPYSADHEQDWQPYPVDPYSLLHVMMIFLYIHPTLTHALEALIKINELVTWQPYPVDPYSLLHVMMMFLYIHPTLTHALEALIKINELVTYDR